MSNSYNNTTMSSPYNNIPPEMTNKSSNVGTIVMIVLTLAIIIGFSIYVFLYKPTLTPPPPAIPSEVFSIGTYKYSRDQALGACQKYGADLATFSQLQEVQNKEADWCSTGWVKDSSDAYYPITTTLREGCGNGTKGLKKFTPDDNIAGVNCYGVKPAQGTPDILPFNDSKWSANS